MNREAIYAALYTRGKTASGFSSTSRRLKHIEDLSPADFPAFYQVQMKEDWSHQAGNLPPTGALRVEWWVYVYGSDPDLSPGAQLNPLIDSLCASIGLPPAVNPSLTGAQSLGGLVTEVRLDGSIEYADGALDDRGFARIPLLIKLPG
jgi:hypothetical protein